MAATDNTTGSAAQDVVCVLDESLTQVFELARPMKAVVKEEAKMMEHPIETGAVVTDHRILLPVEIQLSLVLSSEEYRDVYQQIRELFHAGELLTVQTRTGSYPDMVIQSMPHEETPDMADGTTLALSLRETQFVEPQFSDLKVSKPADGNTVKRGEQQPAASPERKGSVLSGVFK